MKNKQEGVVLIVSLIMLLMMTLLGVTAMNTSSMEEKMAGNSRDVELALESSETALRNAELWLANQAVELEPKSNGSTRIWTLNAMDPTTSNAVNWWQERNTAWWGNNAVAYDASVTLPLINSDPYTIIEYKQFIPDDLLVGNGNSSQGITYYRVTARGTGGSDYAKVLLQSTTARRY